MELEKKYIEMLLHMHFIEGSLKDVKEAWKKYKEAKDPAGKVNREVAWRNMRVLMEDLRKTRRKAAIRGKKIDNEVIRDVYMYLKGIKEGKTKEARGDVWLLVKELGLAKTEERKIKRGKRTKLEITDRGLKCIEALEKYHFRG